MKYGKLTLGEIEAIINKLGGMEGVKRFLSGELVIKETGRKFKNWKTIKLGTGLKTAGDFRRALCGDGFNLSKWASDNLGKPAFTVALEETEVDLVKVTVGELGFKKGARRDQIYERAKELGLELCPSEVGPQLRLQYKDQPNGEWILVAMEPIVDSGDGCPRVLFVERNYGRWLRSHCARLSYCWDPDHQWVFCRPRE